MKRIPRLGITTGDPNGIGPEIIARSLAQWDFQTAHITVFGDSGVFPPGTRLPGAAAWEPVDPLFRPVPGRADPGGGRYAMQSLEAAARAAKAGSLDGIVTAPISKETVNLAGWAIPGHTEWLADVFQADVLMILTGRLLSVAMVTGHIPLKDVPARVTKARIESAARKFDASLRADFGLSTPRIAVFGLNPHAGDGGILGTEEQEIIIPAIKSLQNDGILCEGPFPSDGFFGNRRYLRCDGVLAMYHDQGLTAFKALEFGSGVNFTAGLPIVRTSPDHGTAFDIAGTGAADPSSFLNALQKAAALCTNRINAALR